MGYDFSIDFFFGSYLVIYGRVAVRDCVVAWVKLGMVIHVKFPARVGKLIYDYKQGFVKLWSIVVKDFHSNATSRFLSTKGWSTHYGK